MIYDLFSVVDYWPIGLVTSDIELNNGDIDSGTLNV